MSEELYRATVRIDPDMTGFDEKVEAKVEEATRPRDSRGRFVKINADVDTAGAEAKLAALDESVKKVNRDSDDLSVKLNKLREDAGGFSAIGLGLTAALPLIPTLVGGLGAVAGAVTTIGAASLTSGGVLVTSITQAVKANQELAAAQKAVDDATTKAGRTKALEEQAALIDKLGPSTIAFGQALSDITADWTKFADSFIPQELQLASGFEHLEKDVLPQLRPLISNTFGVAQTEIAKLDAAVNSPGGKNFFSWLATEGPHDLQVVTDGLGHFAAGFGHLLIAFTPVERELVQGFDNIGRRFAAATQDLGTNSGFQKFLTTVERDGPLLIHTLSDVASAVGHIGLSLSPLLPLELKFIDGLAKLVSDHPAIAAALGGIFLGFESLKVVNTVTGPISTLFDLLKGANTWMAGTAAAQTAVAASTTAVGAAAVAAEAPSGLFLGIVGDFSPVSFSAAAGMNAFAGAEVFAGSAAAAAEGPVAALGATIASTNAVAATLLGNLSRIGVLGALPLLGVGAMKDVVGGPATSKTGDSQLDALYAQVGNEHNLVSGYHAKPPSRDQVIQYISQYGNAGDLAQLYDITDGQYGKVSVAGANSTGTINSSGGDIGHGFGIDRSTEYSEQVPGADGSAFGNPTSTYLAQFNSQLNNPANFLPLSGGGRAAGSTAAANLISAQGQLVGLNIMSSLAQGISTGTNPLSQAFSNLNQKLTGQAQTLATALEQSFNAALQVGQAAKNSLLGSISNAPVLGSSTTYFMDASGKTHITSTPAGPSLLYGLQQTLGTDQRFVTDIAKARKLGLNNTLLQQFVQAGPSSLDQLDQLVNGSPGDIASINKTFGQITGLANQYGTQQAQLQYLSEMSDDLKTLITAVVSALPPAIGKQVAAALNTAVAPAARAAAATPRKGVLAR